MAAKRKGDQNQGGKRKTGKCIEAKKPQLKGNELLSAYKEVCKGWDRDMLHLLNPEIHSLDTAVDEEGTTRREELLDQVGHNCNSSSITRLLAP